MITTLKKKKTFIVAINPEKIIFAYENEEFKKVLNFASYQLPDGIGVILASKINKGNINKRITGIDLMEKLCYLANEKKYKIFLLGASNQVLNKAVENIKIKYPKIKKVGYNDGYFSNNEKLINKINKIKPDILFVALGSPKQENWIYNNISKVDAVIFQGVGGSFDIFSGLVKRSPKIFSKIGLEWLYRLIKNPKRIRRQKKLINYLILLLKRRREK